MRGRTFVLLAGGLVPLVLLLVAALPALARKPEAAVVAARDGDLWVGKTQVTSGRADDTSPDWSPDRLTRWWADLAVAFAAVA